MTKLEKLTADQWRLAEAMEKSKSIGESAMIMARFVHVTYEIYIEESKLEGISRKKADKIYEEFLAERNLPDLRAAK